MTHNTGLWSEFAEGRQDMVTVLRKSAARQMSRVFLPLLGVGGPAPRPLHRPQGEGVPCVPRDLEGCFASGLLDENHVQFFLRCQVLQKGPVFPEAARIVDARDFG